MPERSHPVAAARLAFITTLFLLLPFPAASDAPVRVAREVPDGTASLIDDYMSRWHEVGRFNGSVLVAKDGAVVFKKGYGAANREWDIPNAPDTRFAIRSISKQFTTVLVLQLVAEGKIRLEASLVEYLPSYRRDTGSQVTIDHLLQHTAGIPCYINDGQRRPPDRPKYSWSGRYERTEFVREFLSEDLMFEPGSRYKYSNTGYYLLALVVEEVTGRSYAENLQQRVFDPLGMRASGVDSRDRIIPRQADGYSKAPGGFVNVSYDNPDNLLGAGNLYSTVEDLLLWNLALEGDRLLPAEWREKMFTPYWTEPREEHAYSLNYFSFRTAADGEVRFSGFSGGGPGFNTDAFRFPDAGLIVVIFENSTQYNHWRIGPGIHEIVAGRTPRPPRPLLADTLAEIVTSAGPDAALRKYEEVRRSAPEAYETGSLESDINGLGYAALSLGDTGLAVDVLGLNVKLFPDSWNVYDSLGEAYSRAGRREPSERNYAIARELRDRVDTLVNLLVVGDFAQARTVAEQAQQRTPGAEVLPGRRVGPLFEQALLAGDQTRALEISRVWAVASPKAAGPYFSMARIFRARGDTDELRACYRKILEIQPDGPSAEAARTALSQVE